MKTKNIFLTASLVALSFTMNAQVGIGTINPQGTLDVVSTNSGVVVPRVSSTAAVTTPVNGMIIYDVSFNCFKGYQNGAWTDCGFVPFNSILVQIGNEGDDPNTVPSVVTAAQLASVPGVTGVVTANEAAYQAYIDANPELFSAPATVTEVNDMITVVNAFVASNGSALVSSYSCSTASAGTMTESTVVSGVTQTITATVTSVGTYSISTTSNGVTFAASGTFSGTGAQNIVLTATGTPIAAGTHAFVLNTTPGCSFDRTTAAAVPTITSTTGKVWMDRNLGATRVAISVTDHLAYGDLYQWGRKADGHEKISWTNGTSGTPVNGTTSTNADTPANNLFITEPVSPHDWRVSSDNNLWTGQAAVNNPCPAGFRLPTSQEMDAEVTEYGINNNNTAFNSPFKFTPSGYRQYDTGALSTMGRDGAYWTSSVSGNSPILQYIYPTSSGSTIGYKANGFSVRCIRD